MCLDNCFSYDLCYVSCFYGKNYGTMLVSYATYKLLEKTGLSILVLNKPDIIWADGHERESENPIAYTFARKYYANISRCHSNVADLAHLNDECQAFVVGSDQLFLPGLRLDSLALLPFVRLDRRKIAYATSFGRDEYLAPLERLQQNKALLQRFDFLSLREYPQHLMRNVFELNAAEVLEPTLCIPEKHYSELADTANDLQLPEEPYLLTYLLDANAEKEKAICHIARKLGIKVIFIRNIFSPRLKYNGSRLKGNRDFSPEQFLKLYRGASFVVTDSFHGTCFAIRFRKSFVSFVNNGRGALRYQLFERMNLGERLLAKPDDVFMNDNWLLSIDYSLVNSYLEKEAAKSEEWLMQALEGIGTSEKYSAKFSLPSALNDTASSNVLFVPDVTDYTQTPFTVRDESSPISQKRERSGLCQKAHSVAHIVRDFFRKLRGKNKIKPCL